MKPGDFIEFLLTYTLMCELLTNTLPEYYIELEARARANNQLGILIQHMYDNMKSDQCRQNDIDTVIRVGKMLGEDTRNIRAKQSFIMAIYERKF